MAINESTVIRLNKLVREGYIREWEEVAHQMAEVKLLNELWIEMNAYNVSIFYIGVMSAQVQFEGLALENLSKATKIIRKPETWKPTDRKIKHISREYEAKIRNRLNHMKEKGNILDWHFVVKHDSVFVQLLNGEVIVLNTNHVSVFNLAVLSARLRLVGDCYGALDHILVNMTVKHNKTNKRSNECVSNSRS